MTAKPTPSSITFDANTLLGALSASNPDLAEESLHAILRDMITSGQKKVAEMSTEDHPLRSRIRLPVSGKPTARDPAPTPTLYDSPTGQSGQRSKPHEILGPKAAAAALGISRSTLDNWRRDGLIIAIPKGRRGHVIPLVQFVHSQPHPDIAALLRECQNDAVRALERFTATQT